MRPPVRKYTASDGYRFDVRKIARTASVPSSRCAPSRSFPPIARSSPPRSRRITLVADVDVVVVVSSSPLFDRFRIIVKTTDDDEKGCRARGERRGTCGARREGGGGKERISERCPSLSLSIYLALATISSQADSRYA